MGTRRKVCVIIPPAPGLFDQRTNVPLGPLYVAAALERREYDVELVSLLGRGPPAFWTKADLYAIGFTTPQRDAAVGILALIRSQYPKAKILAAGPHVEYEAVDTLEAGFDAVLVGEAELSIESVMTDLPHLSQIYYGTPPSDLDRIPFPARHLLPKEDLYNGADTVFLGSYADSHVASIMGSRGCPYHCSFCANTPARLRHRSAGNIVAEMRQLADMGICYFKFQDDSFTVSERAVIELGAAAAEEFGPGEIVTRMHTRVDILSEEVVAAMKQLSAKVLAFGLESGSQKILDISNKGFTVAQSEHALRMAHDAGLTTLGHFLFGLPGEDEETVGETFEFIRRNKPYLDRLNMSVFVPYPGCDIANRPEQYGMHILERDWNEYWATKKQKIFALPDEMSYQKMMDLLHDTFAVLTELGYANPEWKADLEEDA